MPESAKRRLFEVIQIGFDEDWPSWTGNTRCSGFWWAVSTLLTVGYGDIYPITFAGRIFGNIITFLGVGLGAEGYQDELGITLKEMVLKEHHPWIGLCIKELDISRQTITVLVRRNGKLLIPSGSLELQIGDLLLLYTKKVYRNMVKVEN